MTALLWRVQVVNAAGPGAWVTLVGFSFCFLISGLCWRRGERRITRSDWAFFCAGLATTILWQTTKDALATALLLTLIDFLAIAPTVRKSWTNPWEENLPFYALTTVKYALNLLAIKNLIAANWLYAASMIVQCGGMTLLLMARRRVLIHIKAA